MRQFTILHPELIDKTAKEFSKLFLNHRLFAFYGEMGAGKTTFIKALCRVAGVKDIVSSPSYALIYEYITESGKIIYHFDLYRIRKVSELFDLGYEDYLYSNKLCFIEWPEMAEDILPEETVKVFLTIDKDGSRKLLVDL